jgi:hypothetical protein
LHRKVAKLVAITVANLAKQHSRKEREAGEKVALDSSERPFQVHHLVYRSTDLEGIRNRLFLGVNEHIIAG